MNAELLLDMVIQAVGFLLTVLLTTVLSGTIVRMSKRSGKLIGSEEFRSFWTLWVAFFVEAVILSVLFTITEPVLDLILHAFWQTIPAISIEAFFLFFLWFCTAFNFSIGKHWKFIVFTQFVVIGNLILYMAVWR